MITRIALGRDGRVRRADGGFTLIEVLVVVAIIALLVAILLPSLAKVREQSRRAVCLSHLHQFGIAFSLYSADSNQYLPMSGLPHYKYFMKHGRFPGQCPSGTLDGAGIVDRNRFRERHGHAACSRTLQA